MNINILTTADLAGAPEAPAGEPGPTGVAPAGQTPTADDYWARLRKYVPAETIGAYLLLDGLVRQLFKNADTATPLRIGLILVALLLLWLTWVASKTLLKVKRTNQRLVSLAAFVFFIVGQGSFLSTYDWWQPVIGTIAVVVFGVIVAVYQVGPLSDG